MGYITSDELARRLDSPGNLTVVAGQELADTRSVSPLEPQLVNPDALKLPSHSNALMTIVGNRKTLTDLGREVVGIQGHISGASPAAAIMGVTPQTVVAAMEGKVQGPMGRTIPGLKERIEDSVEKVRALCLDKMTTALTNMTDEKFENKDIKELSQVTANLGRVISATADRNSTRINAGQVIFVTPGQASPDEYKQVDVN